MNALQTTEAVQTTAATTQAPTAVTADSMLTWTQMEDTAPADQGSYRMMLHSLVMVSKDRASALHALMYVCTLLCFGVLTRRVTRRSIRMDTSNCSNMSMY